MPEYIKWIFRCVFHCAFACVNISLSMKWTLLFIKVLTYNCLCFTGGFLSDAGWFAESEKVLLACQDLCRCTEPCVKYWLKLLECYHKYVSFTGENAVCYLLYLMEFVEAVFLRRKLLSFWTTQHKENYRITGSLADLLDQGVHWAVYMFRLFKTFSILVRYCYHSHRVITLSDKCHLSLPAAIQICHDL